MKPAGEASLEKKLLSEVFRPVGSLKSFSTSESTRFNDTRDAEPRRSVEDGDSQQHNTSTPDELNEDKMLSSSKQKTLNSSKSKIWLRSKL